MSTVTVKRQCFNCKKATRTFNCEGCSQNFCADCLTKHLQDLKKHLITIDNDSEQFRTKLNEQKKEPKKRWLIQEIDQWEDESINKIKQIAQQCRQRITNYTTKFINNIENKLNDLVKQIKQLIQENQFNEIDLDELKEKLVSLKDQLDKPPHVHLQQQSSIFINKIYTVLPIDKDTKWKANGMTVAGGNGQGDQLNQLSGPQCIFIDENQIIYIADSANHRIISWKPNETFGHIVAGGFGKGNQANQLDCPGDLVFDHETKSFFISDLENKRIVKWSTANNNNTGQIFLKDIDCNSITIDKSGAIYISDSKKNEVRRWRRGDKTGSLVAGGNGQGNAFNQLNYPTCIFIDDQYSLFISDCLNHRIVKYPKDAREGIVVAGGNEPGDGLNQLYCPQGVIVDQLGGIYIADWGNHRIMRWYQEDSQGTIILGGNQPGSQPNQFNCPVGLAFDAQGNLYVTDSENHRVQKFEID